MSIWHKKHKIASDMELQVENHFHFPKCLNGRSTPRSRTFLWRNTCSSTVSFDPSPTTSNIVMKKFVFKEDKYLHFQICACTDYALSSTFSVSSHFFSESMSNNEIGLRLFRLLEQAGRLLNSRVGNNDRDCHVARLLSG
jgi:hypothetical protein